MKVSVLLLILFLTCASAKNLKCWISHGLSCKVLNEDLRDFNVVTFDIGELEVEDFEGISLIETKINDVPSGIFSFFVEAKEFVLSENELKEWKPEYLKGADKLTHLLITQNLITNLPADAFTEAPNLERIELSNNRIAKISPNAFAGLNRLTDLRINSNQIGADLRVDTFSEIAKTLIKLNIADNKIETIPEGLFKKMEKLEELTIYYNEKIKEIDGKEVLPGSLKKIVGCELK
jgi:Leucine-rich repeat (LRR) protein